jgi:hypothetical protein
MITETKVVLKCVAKKELINYDPAYPKRFEIEFDIPYAKDNVYSVMSGGTKPTLCTVNTEAANMFVIGKDYEMKLRPVPGDKDYDVNAVPDTIDTEKEYPSESDGSER